MTVKNVLVLHGPNLNLLGQRPGDDPSVTLDGLNHQLQVRANALGLTLRSFQSNHEGELIDRLHLERQWADALLLGPGALAHGSYVLREALVAVGKPAIEVHLTDLRRAEAWRRKSVLKDVCVAQVMGKGIGSYLEGLERLAGSEAGGNKRPGTRTHAQVSSSSSSPGRAGKATNRESRGGPPKRVGRGGVEQPAGGVGKTLGRGGVEQPSGARRRAADRAGTSAKTLGREGAEVPLRGGIDQGAQSKSLGRGARAGGNNVRQAVATDLLTRALVRQKISQRLSGELTPAGLASWARTQWNQVQAGGPAEVDHRDELEDVLQTLTLSTMAASRVSDDQLVDLMAQLDR